MTAPVTPLFTVFDDGDVVPSAWVYTYITGTTTPVTTYRDAALTTANANPIVANANGQISFYMPTTTAIRLDLYTPGGIDTGEFLETIDPVYPASIASGTGGSTSEATIASATTTDLGSAGVNIIKVTGTATIVSLGSSAVTSNPIYYVRFDDAVVLTYNATSLILPGSANITTAANAAAIFEYLGSGNWQCLFYQTATGAPLLAPAQILLSTQVVSSPAASVDFTSGINSTYAHYIVEISNLTMATADALDCRLRQAGSFVTSANYEWALNGVTSEAGAIQAGANATSLINLCNLTTIDTTIPSSFIVHLFQPSLSAMPSVFWQGVVSTSGATNVLNGAGHLNISAVTDGIRFMGGSFNINSGTFKLYGVN